MDWTRWLDGAILVMLFLMLGVAARMAHVSSRTVRPYDWADDPLDDNREQGSHP